MQLALRLILVIASVLLFIEVLGLSIRAIDGNEPFTPHPNHNILSS